MNPSVSNFYINILKNNKFDENTIKIISNEDKKFPGGFKDAESNIFWKANSGYNGPVVCEHVTLNSELILNGYKLFINPKMMYSNG